MKRVLSTLLLSCGLMHGSALGQELPPTLGEIGFRIAFENLAFERAIWVGQPPGQDDVMVVAQQDGQIFAFVNVYSVRRVEPILDLRSRVHRGHNEEGLLGVAFHPDFANNRQVFLHYSAERPRRGVVSRFEVARGGLQIVPTSEEILLEVEQPHGNHNGGDLRFGPDGYLYLTFGDGGSAGDPRGNAQDLSTLLGSILRIDVDGEEPYAIPQSNPFVETEGARGEIWAYGLRNVWRFSFDRSTGQLWAGDVGQDRWEEIDIITAGANYGWNHREGPDAYRGDASTDEFVEPIYSYPRRHGQSITGGFVYRGREFPELDGGYVYADYETGYVWILWYDGRRVTRHHTIGRLSEISSFGEDHLGELYLCSFDGRIYRLSKSPR